MPEQYTYAVARIRVKETTLLTAQDIEQLMALKSYEECLRLLSDKGWGDGSGNDDMERLLSYELQKAWDTVLELVSDRSVFDMFLYAIDFHNVKAAIKAVVTNADSERLFVNRGTVPAQTMVEAVKSRDFSKLPKFMQGPAHEAFLVLLKTGDGQLCDIILDHAALESVYKAGMDSDCEILQKYAELTVAVADIKIAVRAEKTGKSKEFLNRAMVCCRSLSKDSLMEAAAKSSEAIYDYLSLTAYADAVPALKESASAFEKWCDNLIMSYIKSQKSNPFTIGPLAAFILARENEIKSVRVILSGKLNHLKDEAIRERLREMYV